MDMHGADSADRTRGRTSDSIAMREMSFILLGTAVPLYTILVSDSFGPETAITALVLGAVYAHLATPFAHKSQAKSKITYAVGAALLLTPAALCFAATQGGSNGCLLYTSPSPRD